MALYGKIRAKLGGKPFCTMVVLAAGSSKRMGRDKLMMEVGGIPVLVRSLQAMQNCRGRRADRCHAHVAPRGDRCAA